MFAYHLSRCFVQAILGAGIEHVIPKHKCAKSDQRWHTNFLVAELQDHHGFTCCSTRIVKEQNTCPWGSSPIYAHDVRDHSYSESRSLYNVLGWRRLFAMCNNLGTHSRRHGYETILAVCGSSTHMAPTIFLGLAHLVLYTSTCRERQGR